MLFNDNLVWNKELNIPANTQNFFIFKKHWDYSQLIIFDINNVYVSSLYCIIQSYLNNKDLYSTAIFTCQINKYNETKILSYHNIFIVKKMNYFFFNNNKYEKMNEFLIKKILNSNIQECLIYGEPEEIYKSFMWVRYLDDLNFQGDNLTDEIIRQKTTY